jgi:hypothetical protein
LAGSGSYEGSPTAWLARGLPPACCPADFNCDGFADFFDYDDFTAAFEAGSPTADINQDGFVDFFDYSDFVSIFEAGC